VGDNAAAKEAASDGEAEKAKSLMKREQRCWKSNASFLFCHAERRKHGCS
jgi:hypothetical protein